MCFVCGPARVHGDGLRVRPGPLPPHPDCRKGTLAATWVPYSNLASEDRAVAGEFVWAALDCPTGYAGLGARHLGMTGAETILLGRMSARIERRPYPGDRCIIVAWPTGKDGRKLFASSALLSSDGEFLAGPRQPGFWWIGRFSSAKLGTLLGITRITIAQLPRCIKTLTRKRDAPGKL